MADQFGGTPTPGGVGPGGGIYNAGTTTLTNCTLTGNSASGGIGGGGGFLTTNDGAPAGAGEGGGLYNLNIATVTNCTLIGNGATGGRGGSPGYDPLALHTGGMGGDGEGAGIFNLGTLTLGSGTLTNDWAVAGIGGGGGDQSGFMGPPGSAQGGGIFQGATGIANERNDLPPVNVAATNGPDVYGAFVSQGYNLIGKQDGSTGFTNGVNHDLAGTIAGPIDAKLGGLGDNGGPTLTAALMPGSPAIDAGTGSGAPVRDQRAYLRAGAAPDIGAFEFEGTIPVTLANISTPSFGADRCKCVDRWLHRDRQRPEAGIAARDWSLDRRSRRARESFPGLVRQRGSVAGLERQPADAPNKQAIIDSGIPPSIDLESAVLVSLDPGAYTVILSGAGGGTGIGLVEAYDLDLTAGSKLANISSRGVVEVGDNVMIGGFIVQGPDSQRVIVRAIGPSLPVDGALRPPTPSSASTTPTA